MSKTIIFRTALALAAVSGVTLQILTDGAGMLLYYTVISNILVAIFTIFLVIFEVRRDKINDSPRILRTKGAVTLSIAITFVIYHFLLAPLVEAEQFWNIRNFLVHYITPLGFIFDGFIFDKKNTYRLFDPLWWTALPLLYSIFAIFNGLVLKFEIPGSPDSPFPYFFLNIDKYGFGGVIKNSAGIFAAYLASGFIWMAIKKIVGPRK